MKFRLKKKLLYILGAGMIAALIGQLFTRYYLELPSLIALEARSDSKDVERVRLAMDQLVKKIAVSSIEYGTWDDTFEAVTMNPEEPAFEKFTSINLVPSIFEALDVDGGLFVEQAGNIKYSSHLEKISSRFGPEAKLDPKSLKPDIPYPSRVPVKERLITAGFSQSNLGPVIFAASHIIPSLPPYPASRGIWIWWRLADSQVFNAVIENVQIQAAFIPIAEAAADTHLSVILEKLMASVGHLPRDNGGYLYWLFNDLSGQPMFLVKQNSDKRAFAENLVSESVVIGFAISAFILIIVALFFSRDVLGRLLHAKALMLKIIETGEYDKRLETNNSDEIDTMFTQFNQLLAYIEMQNKELKGQNQELTQLSQQDALTGIPNRRYLDEALDRCWHQSVRSKSFMSVLMIDVDYFKAYNDNYGHKAGDQVLRQIAQTLQNHLHRATDYIARYGGEEFCAILTDTSPEAAFNVGERLCRAIQDLNIKHEASGSVQVVTVSIGISAITPTEIVVDFDLIKAADEALYMSKERGRNQVNLNRTESYGNGSQSIGS
ncbi:MAG: diguanylate cyclase [Gammaproteobacteria bacterium]|nr:diguanylate cyclase [Gammaproteobacteria bacterium]